RPRCAATDRRNPAAPCPRGGSSTSRSWRRPCRSWPRRRGCRGQDRHGLRQLRDVEDPPRGHGAAGFRRSVAAHRGRHRERRR
ncbi:hypothetical protein C6A85_15890, partial [Mycobacterium sp. ITM-2017-0098]